MTKLFKSILALGIAAALLFALAACNGNKAPETTDPEITEEITTELEPDTLDVASTEDEDTTEEEDTTEGETTTEEATTGAPKTKEEIIDYFNAAMVKVRADKPGYTNQERTLIDDTKISSSKGWINTIAPPIIRMAKGIWSSWSDPSVKAKGTDHSGLRPVSDIQSAWVKSATCTESGGNYSIRLYLVDERVRELPINESDTMHGKAIACYTKGDITDGAGDVGVDISKFDCRYSGSYIDCTINKATGAMVKMNTYSNAQVDLEAKVPVLGTLDASLPLAQERMFTF